LTAENSAVVIKPIISGFMGCFKSESSNLIKCDMSYFIQKFEESKNTRKLVFMENEDFLEVTTRTRESVQKNETLPTD
jgi:hypothetical protein